MNKFKYIAEETILQNEFVYVMKRAEKYVVTKSSNQSLFWNDHYQSFHSSPSYYDFGVAFNKAKLLCNTHNLQFDKHVMSEGV